jgi:tripartite-type tricarboxylate transporter receptor subunit TctC
MAGKELCMKVTKIIFVLVIISLSLFTVALAQDKYPSKPITLIVGYAPGGAAEITARALGNAASKFLGQPIVITTKPGAGSAVALGILKNEKPDGYTIAQLATGGINAQFLNKVPYDVVKDFTHIMHYSMTQSGIVVRGDAPWKTYKDFIEYAKANPGKIRYGTAGPGSPGNMGMEQLAMLAGIKVTHIPFEGTSNAIAALLGGHVEACSESTFFKPHVVSGRLRLLVSYGDERISFAPNVPSLKELGFDMAPLSVFGIIGPKGLSPQIVSTLDDAFKKAMNDPDVKKLFTEMDILPKYLGPVDFSKYLVKMNNDVSIVVKQLGLKTE